MSLHLTLSEPDRQSRAEALLEFAEIGVTVDLDLSCVALRLGEIQALLSPFAAVQLALWLAGAAMRARKEQWAQEEL